MGRECLIIWGKFAQHLARGEVQVRSISILLVEDSALFRSALHNVFSQSKVFALDVCSSASFLRRITRIGHDAVAIDAVTWAGGLQALVGAVQRVSTVAPVIILGREDLLDRHLEVLQAGAAGFVKQTASPQALIKAVRAVASGEVWFERKVFRKVFVKAPEAEMVPQVIRFSAKEKQIVELVASGKSNKEIGALLGFKERTIKAYVSNLFLKTRATNRSSLTSYAITHGLTRLMPG